MTDVDWFYEATIVVCGTGLAIGTLEYWSIASSFSPTGVYPWEIIRERLGTPWLGSIKQFHVREVRALLALRAVALLVFTSAPYRSALFSVAVATLIVSAAVLRWRTAFDEDGSDRMNSVVLLTLLLCTGPLTTPFILAAGLWFIALQVCLSYAASGIAKLASNSWRRGDALYRILSTKTYGLGSVACRLRDRRRLRIVLCWSLMLGETLFPLSLVMPPPVLWLFLACCGVFHVLIAAIMGFNTFVWAFGATYPALVYAASARRAALF